MPTNMMLFCVPYQQLSNRFMPAEYLGIESEHLQRKSQVNISHMLKPLAGIDDSLHD